MNELALFAGAGGGILAGQMLGWRTVCAVEWEAYPASVLAARQNDGHLEPFPIWDDVRTFDGKRWRGRVDIVSGGFPCQDISAAGKGAGIEGERSGMWVEMARIIGEVRPRFAFVENSPMLCSRGLGRVLGDLAALGFDAEWGVLGANAVGAPHRRERIWIVGKRRCRLGCLRCDAQPPWHDVAHAKKLQRDGGDDNARVGVGKKQISEPRDGGGPRNVADPSSVDAQGEQPGVPDPEIRKVKRKRPAGSCCDGGQWWATEPDLGRVANGVAHRVDRLKAIGNGQVPQCAAAAFIEGCRRLME